MKTLWIFKDRNGVRVGFHKPTWDKEFKIWESGGVYEIEVRTGLAKGLKIGQCKKVKSIIFA